MLSIFTVYTLAPLRRETVLHGPNAASTLLLRRFLPRRGTCLQMSSTRLANAALTSRLGRYSDFRPSKLRFKTHIFLG